MLQLMNEMFRITEANYIMYAMKNYDNPHCLDMAEFHDDLKRIKYIKRLLNRYQTTCVLKERLILNHIILLYNVFTVEAATKMLFYKIDKELWPSLKTFLLFLNYMPERISGIDEQDIISSDIVIEMNVANTLRQMNNEN